MQQAQSKQTVIETKNKFDERTQYTILSSVTTTSCHPNAHKLEALGTVRAFPIVLVPLLGVGTRELLTAHLALVYRRVLRMRACEVTVTIVLAGKRSPAFATQVTNGWRRRLLDSCLRGGRERRRVGVLESSRGGKRRRGDVLELLTLTLVILLGRLLRLERYARLGNWRLLVTR
jgi:hypothetical protein